MSLNESIVEYATLEWFRELGYAVGHGPHLAPGEPAAERASFGDVVLAGRLRAAIRRLNPAIPEEAREEALRKVLRLGTPSLVQTNRAFHRMRRDEVEVEYARPDGSIAGDHVRLVDFDVVGANDWLVVKQFTVIERQHNRRLVTDATQRVICGAWMLRDWCRAPYMARYSDRICVTRHLLRV